METRRSIEFLMNPTLKKTAQILLFFGLGAVILWFVFKNQNAAFQEQCRLDGTPADSCSLWQKVVTDFRSVNYWWIFGVLAAFTISNLSRAARWLQLIEPLGHKARFANAFWTIQLGYFANLGFPRAGEVVRAGSFSRYEKLPLERVFGTLVIDRLMDFLCLGLVVGLGILLQGGLVLNFINEKRSANSGGSMFENPVFQIGFAALIFGAAVAWFFRKKWMQLPLFQKVMKFAGGLVEGLKSVFKLKKPAVFIGHSLLIWVCYFLQTWFCLQSFGPTAHLGWQAALMIFIFGTLGIVVPSPGGMGTYHVLAIAGLALYGVSGTDGFSFANIMFFSVQIFYMIAMGLAAMAMLPMLNRK